MAAVRVPPSAWITSQSILTWRSPKPARSVTARRLRPISRWISWVRPLCPPRAASRVPRVPVARGSMPYSAVTQPRPELRRKGGTVFSTEAVQRTWVSPKRARQEPSAYLFTPGSRRIWRSWSAARPLARIAMFLSCWRREASLPAGGFPAPGRSRSHHLPPLSLTKAGGLTTFAQAHERIVLFPPGGARAQRALARGVSPHCLRLCRERRAGRLAHGLAPPGHGAVARHHPQCHGGSGGCGPALRPPYFRRPAADGAGAPPLRPWTPGAGPADRGRTPIHRGPVRGQRPQPARGAGAGDQCPGGSLALRRAGHGAEVGPGAASYRIRTSGAGPRPRGHRHR